MIATEVTRVDADTVKRYVKEHPEYVLCRRWGHQWDPNEPVKCPPSQGGGYDQTINCLRCGSMLFLELNNNMQPVKPPTRWWPEGYRLAPGSGRMGLEERTQCYRNLMRRRKKRTPFRVVSGRRSA